MTGSPTWRKRATTRRARSSQHGLHHRAREQRRAADHAGARRRARLPPRRQDGSRRWSRTTAAPPSPSRPRAARPIMEALAQDDAQLQHRLVGRLADLRLRRQIAPPHAARPERSAQSSRWSRRTPAPPGDAFGYLPEFGLPAHRAPCDRLRSDPARMGRTGSGRDARQLVDRALVPAQRVRARAQRLRRRIPQGARRKRRRRIPACATPTGRPTSSSTGRSSNDELFEIARLVVAAEIAKIHTIEWTTQLLYDEPLYAGMNANWSGLFKDDVDGDKASKLAAEETAQIVSALGRSKNPKSPNQFFSALAAGPGIVGTGSECALSGRRERRGQSFRLAVQLPRRVHGGLPAASAGAGHDRVPRAFQCRTRSRSACR